MSLMKTKLKTFLHKWTININLIKKLKDLDIPGLFFNILYMDAVKQFIHQLNREAYNLNKNIVAETNTMQKVPLNKDIYEPQRNVTNNESVPVVTLPHVINAKETIPSNPVVLQDGSKSLETMMRIEKKIDKFFNLIEKRVVNNAKEINIRIKLNENSDT